MNAQQSSKTIKGTIAKSEELRNSWKMKCMWHLVGGEIQTEPQLKPCGGQDWPSMSCCSQQGIEDIPSHKVSRSGLLRVTGQRTVKGRASHAAFLSRSGDGASGSSDPGHSFCKWSLHKVFVVQSLSRVDSFTTPWPVDRQVPLSMGFPRQEYWSGLPFPSPGDLPGPGIEPTFPVSAALQKADSLPTEASGKSLYKVGNLCKEGAWHEGHRDMQSRDLGNF